MNTLNPQPILASSSDELYNPFSEEARISPYNPHILFEPVPCPIDGATSINGKLGLTAAGGPVPKSALGLRRGIGGASRYTTLPSAAAHYAGGRNATWWGGAARGLGRFFSRTWITYGLTLAAIEAYCLGKCANDRCAY
jgi:hypothetical protein